MFTDINLFGTEKREDNNQIITMYGSEMITVRVSTVKNMSKSMNYNILIRSKGPDDLLDGVHSLLQYFIMSKYESLQAFKLHPWIPVSAKKMRAEMDCDYLDTALMFQSVHYYVEVISPYKLFEFFKNCKGSYSSSPNKNDRVNGWTELEKEGKFLKFA